MININSKISIGAGFSPLFIYNNHIGFSQKSIKKGKLTKFKPPFFKLYLKN